MYRPALYDGARPNHLRNGHSIAKVSPRRVTGSSLGYKNPCHHWVPFLGSNGRSEQVRCCDEAIRRDVDPTSSFFSTQNMYLATSGSNREEEGKFPVYLVTGAAPQQRGRVAQRGSVFRPSNSGCLACSRCSKGCRSHMFGRLIWRLGHRLWCEMRLATSSPAKSHRGDIVTWQMLICEGIILKKLQDIATGVPRVVSFLWSVGPSANLAGSRRGSSPSDQSPIFKLMLMCPQTKPPPNATFGEDGKKPMRSALDLKSVVFFWLLSRTSQQIQREISLMASIARLPDCEGHGVWDAISQQ